MSKDKLTDYDSAASGNLDVGGISVAEGMLPSGVNNAIREQMSHLKDFASGTTGIDVLSLADDDASHAIKLQAPSAVTADTTFTLPDGDGTADQVLKTDGSGQLGWADRHANPSLITNGGMTVAQRGTSGTSTADIYTVDRFAIGHGAPVNAMTFEQSTDAPNNFKNSIKITAGTGASASTTGYAILRQAIEGQNISHLGFGTSAAKAIILSFYVKSSLTGTFGVSIRNQAGTRGYGGTYIINSANTWEYVTIAIPADTGGTWPTDNGIGLNIMWDLGAGSNYDIASGSWTDGTNIIGVESTVKLTETTGATWQMTGVKLEVGSTTTDFQHRSYGDELARCQRYFYQHVNGTNQSIMVASAIVTNYIQGTIFFPVPMRTAPTFTSADGSNYFQIYSGTAGAASFNSYGSQQGHVNGMTLLKNGTTITSGESAICYTNNANAFLRFDAEL